MPQTGKFGLLFQKNSAQTQKGFEFILSGPNRQFDLGLSAIKTLCFRIHRYNQRHQLPESPKRREVFRGAKLWRVHLRRVRAAVCRAAALCFRHSARSAALAPGPCAMVIPIGCDLIWVDRMRASRDASRFRSMGLALAAQRPWGWGAQRRVCSPRMRDGEALGAHIPQVDWGSFASPVAEKC